MLFGILGVCWKADKFEKKLNCKWETDDVIILLDTSCLIRNLKQHFRKLHSKSYKHFTFATYHLNKTAA